ncbi:MAG: hypothetical protein Q8N28_01170 [bacterium]|nr:hypothetical protein [bacterium]
MNKKKIIFIISSVIVIVIVIVIFTQSYPIVLVNWRPISLKSFKKDVLIAVSYYRKALETYDKNQAAVMNSKEVKQKIERAVLDKLIEDNLIQRELEKRLKNNELEKMVNDKIEEALKGKDIRKEVETLFGVSLYELKERFLKPRARWEIFESRLALENKNINDWLKEIKSEAGVMIFFPGFEWNGEGVIIKK